MSLYEAYDVAVNYHYFMQTLEIKALNEEVSFYRASYAVQKEYINSLMNLFRTKYMQFIAELKESLDEPIRNLMLKFNQMKEESSEENLKSFLARFRYSAVSEDLFGILRVLYNYLLHKLFNDLRNKILAEKLHRILNNII